MSKALAAVKKHPWLVAGTIFIVGVIIVLVLARGGGTSSASGATAPATDPNADALAAQTQQIQGSLASQSSGQQFQLDLASLKGAQDQYALDANTALQSKQLDLSSALATLQLQDQSQAQTQTLAANLASQHDAEASAFQLQQLQTDANLHVADTNAATVLGIANINAGLQSQLANFAQNIAINQQNDQLASNNLAAQVAINNTNVGGLVAVNQANDNLAQANYAAKHAGGSGGGFGGFLGGLVGSFL
jgi:hypothetical protein